MKNYIQSLVVIVLAAVIVFMASHMTNLYQGPDLPFQIVTAFISVVMMGIVTWILLKGQCQADEKKDKNSRIFQKKLKVYAGFTRELWKITDKESLAELRDRMLRELVLMLPYEEIDSLKARISELYENIEKADQLNKFKSNITQILKDDILEDNKRRKKNLCTTQKKKLGTAKKKNPEQENANRILQLVNAFRVEKTQADIEDAGIGKNVEKEEFDEVSVLQNTDCRKVWTDYKEGKIQCWHFAAWDNVKQYNALHAKDGTPILSLIEYEEDWRTERLKQVKKDDILFLFNRGGAGYVGMYKAAGNFIIHNPAEGKVTVLRNGCKEERELDEKEIEQYDIYGAYEDDATYISNVIVEKIRELDGDTYNPISVIRQTIARLSKDNVEALLRYFDGKSANN